MKSIQSKSFAILAGMALLFIGMTQSGCKKDDEPVTVTDIDGNIYETVEIGGKLWTTSNLKTSHYNDGTAITTGLDDAGWAANTTGAYGIYEDLSSNNTTYGKLYNWHAVHTGKLSPAGWHIPTRTEWEALAVSLGGGADAGGPLKSTSTLWNAPNTGATNSTGFDGLPAGQRSYLGPYSDLGNYGIFWASSERNTTQGDYMRLVDNAASAFTQGATKEFGFSVRLVQD
jgi:uncharacterized protein (TIGR02145 family)